MRVRPPNMDPIWDGKPVKPEKAPDRKPAPEPDDTVNKRLRKGTFVIYEKTPPKGE